MIISGSDHLFICLLVICIYTYFFGEKNLYLDPLPLLVVVVVTQLVGLWFPDRGLNLGAWRWAPGNLTTASTGASPDPLPIFNCVLFVNRYVICRYFFPLPSRLSFYFNSSQFSILILLGLSADLITFSFLYFLYLILRTSISWLFFSPYCVLHLSLLCCLFLIPPNSKHWSAHGLSPILHYLLCSHLYADSFTFTICLVYSSAWHFDLIDIW